METTTKPEVAPDEHAPAHEHGHGEQHFLTKYVFSSDHKVIGIQYGIGGLLFLLPKMLKPSSTVPATTPTPTPFTVPGVKTAGWVPISAVW